MITTFKETGDSRGPWERLRFQVASKKLEANWIVCLPVGAFKPYQLVEEYTVCEEV